MPLTILSFEDFLEIFSDYLSSFDKNEAHDKPLFTLLRAFNVIIKEHASLNYIDFKEKLIERLNKKEFLGPVKRAISDLSEKIVKSNCSTLGEYFYILYRNGEKIRGEREEGRGRGPFSGGQPVTCHILTSIL